MFLRTFYFFLMAYSLSLALVARFYVKLATIHELEQLGKEREIMPKFLLFKPKYYKGDNDKRP